MKIGDEVFVHGYIDEIRNDTIIIRNVGGYFGTSRDEVFYYEEDELGYGTMNSADTLLTDAEITELAKGIVHKMIDNSDIEEDAYPDLRQRMHEAVERLDEYYPSEDEGASR